MARFRDDPVSAFYEELKNCTRESKFYDTPTRFILASRLLDWLREKPEDGEQSARVNIILETVYHGVEPYPGAFSIFDETMGKSDKRCWLKLFVILLQMAEDGSFARTLHRFFQADIFDTRLTHDFLSSPKLFEVIKATEVYDRATWQQAVNWFCHLAKQLLTRSAITMHHQRSMGEDTILPITAKDDLSPGGQGNISRIEVPHECVSHDLVNRLRCLRREAISDENYPDGKVRSFYLTVPELLTILILTSIPSVVRILRVCTEEDCQERRLGERKQRTSSLAGFSHRRQRAMFWLLGGAKTGWKAGILPPYGVLLVRSRSILSKHSASKLRSRDLRFLESPLERYSRP